MISTADLLARKSRPQDQALPAAEQPAYLAALDGWALRDGKLEKDFIFQNYYRTMAFVNAVAFLAHAEDHHPDLLVSYQHCLVQYRTHSVDGGRGGLSENDFICAAKVDALARLELGSR